VQGETPEAPAIPLGPFSLPVLKIIMEGQGLHGLRYGDYQRYRCDVRVCVAHAYFNPAGSICSCCERMLLHAQLQLFLRHGMVVLWSAVMLPRQQSVCGRQYCARRMQRLRKGLNFVHWEQGKGKSRFVQRAISEETVVDQRYLELVLQKVCELGSFFLRGVAFQNEHDGAMQRE